MGTKLALTMKIIYIFSAILLLNSCIIRRDTGSQRNEWTKAFKRSVFVSAIKASYASNNIAITDTDLSDALNFEVIGNTKFSKIADSIGKRYSLLIKPSIIRDYDGKRAIINESLSYYESKELDSLSARYYSLYKSERQ
jgi:hypothetical protein